MNCIAVTATFSEQLHGLHQDDAQGCDRQKQKHKGYWSAQRNDLSERTGNLLQQHCRQVLLHLHALFALPAARELRARLFEEGLFGRVGAVSLQMLVVLHTDSVEQLQLGFQKVDVRLFVCNQLLEQILGDKILFRFADIP